MHSSDVPPRRDLLPDYEEFHQLKAYSYLLHSPSHLSNWSMPFLECSGKWLSHVAAAVTCISGWLWSIIDQSKQSARASPFHQAHDDINEQILVWSSPMAWQRPCQSATNLKAFPALSCLLSYFTPNKPSTFLITSQGLLSRETSPKASPKQT